MLDDNVICPVVRVSLLMQCCLVTLVKPCKIAADARYCTSAYSEGASGEEPYKFDPFVQLVADVLRLPKDGISPIPVPPATLAYVELMVSWQTLSGLTCLALHHHVERMLCGPRPCACRLRQPPAEFCGAARSRWLCLGWELPVKELGLCAAGLHAGQA